MSMLAEFKQLTITELDCGLHLDASCIRGMVPGDVASNFSALYASALGKNVLPRDMRPDKLDQHQKGVHPEYKRLAKKLLSKCLHQHNLEDNATGYPGIAKAKVYG